MFFGRRPLTSVAEFRNALDAFGALGPPLTILPGQREIARLVNVEIPWFVRNIIPRRAEAANWDDHQWQALKRASINVQNISECLYRDTSPSELATLREAASKLFIDLQRFAARVSKHPVTSSSATFEYPKIKEAEAQDTHLLSDFRSEVSDVQKRIHAFLQLEPSSNVRQQLLARSQHLASRADLMDARIPLIIASRATPFILTQVSRKVRRTIAFEFIEPIFENTGISFRLGRTNSLICDARWLDIYDKHGKPRSFDSLLHGQAYRLDPLPSLQEVLTELSQSGTLPAQFAVLKQLCALHIFDTDDYQIDPTAWRHSASLATDLFNEAILHNEEVPPAGIANRIIQLCPGNPPAIGIVERVINDSLDSDALVDRMLSPRGGPQGKRTAQEVTDIFRILGRLERTYQRFETRADLARKVFSKVL
ncbi:MAG: hypothetical protein EBZ48_00225 [Proteobacteria bacterium]|nr:hypothetical protein [Pseudomonadota bacterium]